jgi:hypothetical protein
VQVETGIQQEFRSHGGTAEHRYFLPTLLRIGVGDRWEARVESNTFTHVAAPAAAATQTQQSSLAPVSLGLKFQIQDSVGLPHPSVGTILRVFPASGTGALHTTHTTGDLRLAADWDLTPRVSLNPNVGVALYESDQNKLFTAGLFALTLNVFNAAKTINPFVDVGVQAPEAPAFSSAVIIDSGIAYLPARNIQIDVSAGTGGHGLTPPHPFVSVGVSLRFRAPEQGRSTSRPRMVDPLRSASERGFVPNGATAARLPQYWNLGGPAVQAISQRSPLESGRTTQKEAHGQAPTEADFSAAPLRDSLSNGDRQVDQSGDRHRRRNRRP